MARSADVHTPLARLAFTEGLFKVQTNDQGRKSWNCTLLFAKGADISVLEKAALEAATEEWGDKAAQMIKDGIIKSPFLDGDGKQGKSKKTGEPHKGFPGHRFIRCTSGEEYRPKVVDRQINPVLGREGCPSGSYGYAMVNAFTWENRENGKGITFGISAVQVSKVATGDEVLGGGGGVDPEQAFEKIPDEGDAPSETKSGAGAAGLFG